MPELRELVRRVEQHSPQMTLARAQLNASRSTYVGARLAPLGNPYLELTAERGNKGATKDVAAQAVLWLPFEVSGQRSSRVEEADAFVALNQAELQHSRAVALAATVEAYGTSAVATERLQVLHGIIESAESEAALSQERLKRGDAVQQDAALATLEVARYEVMLHETRAKLALALSALGTLTGEEYAEGPSHAVRPEFFQTQAFSRAAQANVPLVDVSRAEARYFGASKERFAREGRGPLSLMLIGGRGDLGEARVGGGLAYTFPVFRSNQGEQAVAEAERTRALTEAAVRRNLVKKRILGLTRELREVENALRVITNQALPAAQAAVDSAVATHRAGKGDWFIVLVSRRDLSALSLRKLELAERAWGIVSELVELTGVLP